MSPSELLAHDLCWNGPSWLQLMRLILSPYTLPGQVWHLAGWRMTSNSEDTLSFWHAVASRTPFGVIMAPIFLGASRELAELAEEQRTSQTFVPYRVSSPGMHHTSAVLSLGIGSQKYEGPSDRQRQIDF